MCVCVFLYNRYRWTCTHSWQRKEERSTDRGRQKKDDKRQEEIWEVKTKQDRERESSHLSMTCWEAGQRCSLSEEGGNQNQITPSWGGRDSWVSSREPRLPFIVKSHECLDFHLDFLPLFIYFLYHEILEIIFITKIFWVLPWNFMTCVNIRQTFFEHLLCARAVEMRQANLLSQVNRGNFFPSKYI